MITSDDLTIATPPPATEPAPGEIVHPLACFHRKWQVDRARAHAEWQAAFGALLASFDERQRELYDTVDGAWGWELVAQADTLVDGLAAHFPGLAPAIRAVAYHIEDDVSGTGIAACCPQFQQP